jgi:NAD(P)-dependent dehydrogenase (short-subunit alcohol dehydrogenase family)
LRTIDGPPSTTLDNTEQAARVATIAGAGDRNGAAIPRRFACADYCVCVARRNAAPRAAPVAATDVLGGRVRAFGADALMGGVFAGLVKQIQRAVGPIEVPVLDTDTNVPRSMPEGTSRANCQLTRGAARGTCW